jgi:colanic acid biosynthesis glycosyl transferase WcaI
VKILYISQYYKPEMGAPAARVSELAKYWKKMGHDVTVLTGFPNHPTGIVHKEYVEKFRYFFWKGEEDGIDVMRSWLLPLPNRKPLERILNYSSFFVSSSILGTFVPRHDVLIATVPQLLVGLTGRWLSKCKHTPFLLEVRDLWPDSIVDSDVVGDKSIVIHAVKMLASYLYKSCDHIAVVTPAFREELIEKWNLNPNKISIIENGVETDLFYPKEEAETVKESLGLNNYFVVSYIGTIGAAHGLEIVLKAARELEQKQPDILFLFIGEGAEKKNLESLASGLSNVRFVPAQQREVIPRWMTATDAGLVLLKHRNIFKTVIPTKMLEFMACGCPVILGVDGEAKRVLDSANAGIFIQPECSDALANAVLSLYGNANLRRTFGENGRKYVVENLSRRRTAEQYLQILQEVAGQNVKARDGKSTAKRVLP